MKTILVEVCVCTQCVTHGAMHILEAVESLKQFKYQLRHNAKVVTQTKILANDKHRHTDTAPVVIIDGDIVIEHATSEGVMEKIVQLIRAIPPKS